MKTVMRYNIMRLVREITTYEKQLEQLREGHTILDGRTSEINRISHAKSLCTHYLGKEVLKRIKDGQLFKHEGHITGADYAIVEI